uniref:Uncharacterized protein n=1 Tax=Manihot esculenta TaxID=3983 RepID=A0A2C9VH79_MANES
MLSFLLSPLNFTLSLTCILYRFSKWICSLFLIVNHLIQIQTQIQIRNHSWNRCSPISQTQTWRSPFSHALFFSSSCPYLFKISYASPSRSSLFSSLVGLRVRVQIPFQSHAAVLIPVLD